MSDKRVSIDDQGGVRLAIEGAEVINDCIERLFLACRRSIKVRAPRLDSDFYFSETFSECCRSIITRDLSNQLQFLVEDEQYVTRANSRLVALARQFSSYVKVRVIPEEYIERQEMFIVCDDESWLHQPSLDRPRAVMAGAEPGAARQLGLRFKDLWDRSTPPAELFTTGL